ncbi:MAG: 3'-5' exonuclease [Fervidobacterium sp.]
MPLSTNHFEQIADKIINMYLSDPLDFLFIGPTGFYVRQVADIIASRTKKTINRDAFLVINQYVTEFLKKNNYQTEVFDRDFYIVYISKIIAELYEEEKRSEHPDSEKLLILRTLTKSDAIVQYIVEIFEKLWEIELYGDGKSLSGQYDVVNQLMNDTSTFAQIIKGILDKMKNIVKQLQSRYMYDPMNVYKWYVDNAQDIEKPRKHLVISGFFDLSMMVKNAIKKLIEKSENVTFFVWQKIDDSAFSEIDEIYEFLNENDFKIETVDCEKTEVSLNTLLEGKNVSRIDVENQYSQYQYIIKQVKSLLMEGVKPDDIGVVVPNSNIANLVMEEFEEAGIPYRYSGKNSLIDSQIVKILLQPLLTVENGYKTEDLLAIIESPLVEERDLTMDEVEDLFKEYNYYSLHLKPSEMENKEERRKAFFENLESDIAKLEKEKEEYIIEEDIYLSSIERLEKLRKFKATMENLFTLLDEIHEAWGKADFFTWYKGFIIRSIGKFKKVFDEYDRVSTGQSKTVSKSIGKEINAFAKFIDVLNRLEMYIEKVKESKPGKTSSWSTPFRLFVILLNASGYRETFKSSNVVDILDISTSRFVSKKYKFFLEFTDDHYPTIGKINPLLYRITNQRSKIYDLLEESEKRAFVLSIIFTDHAFLIFPTATSTGDTLVSSKYLSEFAKDQTYYEIEPNDIFKKVDYDIYRLQYGEGRKVELKETDFVVGTIGMLEFSHSKVTSYLACPMLFYYQNVVSIRKPLTYVENMKIGEGLIVHRVLRKFFDGPIGFEVKENALKDIIVQEYDNIFTEGIYRYKVPKEIKVREILGHILPLVNDFVQSRRIINLGNKSFNPKSKDLESKSRSSKKPPLISESTIGCEKETKINFNGFDLTVKVDRIERLQNNYHLTEDRDLHIEKKDQAYALIDYKYSTSTKYSQIEQLLLYDFVLRGSGFIKDNVETFQIFMGVKAGKNGSYDYSYSKRQIENNEHFYVVPAKQKLGQGINMYVKFPVKHYIDWLSALLNEISHEGSFVPVFIDNNSKSFVSLMIKNIPDDIELQIPEGSKKVKICRNKNQNQDKCPYEQLCALYEIYGVKLLK